jgi:hypothetical protein
MTKIKDNDCTDITDQAGIKNRVKEFYEQLYEKREVEEGEIKDLVKHLPQLTDRESEDLEGEITFDEASHVLKGMKNGKSPGTDGFSAVFFKVFWCKLGRFVVRALNTGYGKEKLSCTQRQGIIVCLPKGDKDRDLIKNWRPISLLNTVYKIGSACIALRIKMCYQNL